MGQKSTQVSTEINRRENLERGYMRYVLDLMRGRSRKTIRGGDTRGVASKSMNRNESKAT